MSSTNLTTPKPAQAELTNDEVRRITEEEQLRNRLRKEFDLGTKEKPEPSWWKFLNSHFGLFLLSSVVLAGLTGLYTQAQSYSRQLELRNQEILKASTELKYRLARIKDYSLQMKQAVPGNKVGASRFIWYTVFGGPEYYRPSLPEFAGVTTYGLVGKLRLLGVTAKTDEALESVISLENGQTLVDGNDKVYPQEFLDSHVLALNDYTDGVLVPYLDRQRHQSWLQQLLF